MDIVSQLLNNLSDYQLTNKTIVVAYSGGLDSHVLLDAACLLRQQSPGLTLRAVHINHGINPSADKWQQHCEQVCAELQVPITSVRVSVPDTSRSSLEAEARKVRYRAIADCTDAEEWALLAQHQDDQLETFLLQLKRGAGPKGLAAMAKHFERHNRRFLRPLLECSQQSLRGYAAEHRLQWVEDDSNQDQRFERNFLRHQVLPVLTERWPELAKTVSRSAQLCAEQEQLLDEVVAEKLELAAQGQVLKIPALLQLSATWQRALLRGWIGARQAPLPTSAQLTEVQKSLYADSDTQAVIEWQGWQCRRYQDQLFLIPKPCEINPEDVVWQGQNRLLTPWGNLYLSYQACDEACAIKVNRDLPIVISFRGSSQSLKISGSRPTKALKQWFKEWKIPPWQRNQVLRLSNGDQLVAVCFNGEWRLDRQTTVDRNSSLYLRYAFKGNLLP